MKIGVTKRDLPDNIEEIDSEKLQEKKPKLAMHDYAPGEVRLYAESDKAFGSQEELDSYMKSASAKIKQALNDWAIKRYGDTLFSGYDDGAGIRIQTGLHELTLEDKSKIQDVVRMFNEII